ncbi:unnamed protein product [Mytilus coruscus]|uniref:Uncharacterized protein n=1 Tax=Mytilus coruscus TaxID=42192 RepID=A0A6J8CHT3_MYTCO|nr:unnamed protein product [Mytilus coruscus]
MRNHKEANLLAAYRVTNYILKQVDLQIQRMENIQCKQISSTHPQIAHASSVSGVNKGSSVHQNPEEHLEPHPFYRPINPSHTQPVFNTSQGQQNANNVVPTYTSQKLSENTLHLTIRPSQPYVTVPLTSMSSRRTKLNQSTIAKPQSCKQ